MRKRFGSIAFKFLVIVLFLIGSLFVLVLHPALTYARQTSHNQYTIFHNQALPVQALACLDSAAFLVKSSELYSPELKIDVCLDDGGTYTALMKSLRGRAFAWGLYHQVILASNANFKAGYAELNGYKWNLVQLLAHEMTHCYQFNRFGLLHSSPIADIPGWKVEGYPEYVSRQNMDQGNLVHNIDHLNATLKTDHNGWIGFEDGTGTVIPYYKFWLMMQYCMNVKKMTYQQVLADQQSSDEVNRQMMSWYHTQKNL